MVCTVNYLLNPFTARSEGRLSGEQGSNDDAGLRPTAVCGQERECVWDVWVEKGRQYRLHVHVWEQELGTRHTHTYTSLVI